MADHDALMASETDSEESGREELEEPDGNSSLPAPLLSVSRAIDRIRRNAFNLYQKTLLAKSNPHRTGRSPSDFKQRRDENRKSSRLYRLADELLLEIMTHLDPVDMYVARQSCWLFAEAFAHGTFSDMHRRHRLPRTPLELDDEGGFRPMVGLDTRLFSPAQKSEIARLVRRDFFCQSCQDAHPAAADPSLQCPGDDILNPRAKLTCLKCASKHTMPFFSETQLAKMRHQMVCILWEGKMDLCPHRQVAVGDTFDLPKPNGAPPPCGECKVLFRADRGERCAGPVAWETKYRPVLMVDWTMEVCRLAEGQIVTKDLIRRGLEDLESRFGNRFLCPHLTFRDWKLMDPFGWDRCVCFRDPTPEETRDCYLHGRYCRNRSCCAFRARDRPEAVGRFMALEKARKGPVADFLHELVCRHCDSLYRWGVRSDSITISRFDRCKHLGRGKTEENKPRVRLHWGSTGKEWVAKLDPATYHGNHHHRRHTTCLDKSCWNSRQRQTCWRQDFPYGYNS